MRVVVNVLKMGFELTKLNLINIFNATLGVILIVVCAYEKSIDYTAANNFIGGIITCGILLLIASLMGIIGSMQHNKFLLFSNLITLSFIFVIQLIIGSVCIVFSYRTDTDFNNIFQNGYNSLQEGTKAEIKTLYNCCDDPSRLRQEELYCTSSTPCIDILNGSLRRGLKVSGGLGVSFSVLQTIAIAIGIKYCEKYKF